MSKPLSLGLNLSKKPGLSKPAPPKRKPIFGGDDGDSDDDGPGVEAKAEAKAEAITTLTDAASRPPGPEQSQARRAGKGKGGPQPPSGPPKPKRPDGGGAGQARGLGDLASALTSRKYAEGAEREDPSIYDYDAAYDAFKAPARNAAAAASAAERKPQYMANLKKAVEVRERDRKIAEDKKVKREREAEGDEFADKDMFVTEAYRQQQEENRRLEEEERRREEDEARRNKSGGMTGFYKQLLDRGDQIHAEMVKAAEELQHRKKTDGGGDVAAEDSAAAEEEDKSDDKSAAEKARRINEQGGDVAINEEGQVVDKRELLKGGLNIALKKKQPAEASAKDRDRDRDRRDGGRGASSSLAGRSGGKQAMRDRQSRMLEAQYEQALKRSRDEAAEERAKVELASKSQKTAADISSAKERYLARKKAATEAKAQGLPGEP